MNQDNVFTGPWIIEYVDEVGTLRKNHITADYKVYDEERIIEILNEIHPEWAIERIYKVDKLPWLE